MKDLLNDSGWIKANEMVKEKYGKNISYRAIKLINEDFIEDSASFYVNGDDLIIPLKLKNFDLGDVIVSRGSFLNTSQKTEIADLVKFLVEPKLYSIQLKKSEEKLTKETAHRPFSVISSEENDLRPQDSTKVQRQTLSPVILLKSANEVIRNRVALKIHEMTERNLFVHLDDILASLSSKEDLSTLSDITIYVADIEKLSSTTVSMLSGYLENDNANGPVFLLGTNLSMDAVEKMPYPDSLKKDLMGFYFDVDRVPVSQQTSEDILELLFFQFDSVLS